MMQIVRGRCSALLMLLLLLGAGPGLSGLDALLFHLEGPQSPQIHVEAAGAACHAEACLEWAIGLQGRLIPSAGPSTALALHTNTSRGLTASTTLPRAYRIVGGLPRSPPSFR